MQYRLFYVQGYMNSALFYCTFCLGGWREVFNWEDGVCCAVLLYVLDWWMERSV